jgi:hypothetical protein
MYNVGKPDVEIDVKYSERDRTVRYGLLAISALSYTEKTLCDEECAYMFNVYKNQLRRQTGSRNLMDPKMLPTIWGTYMKLVTKYQIYVEHICTFFVTFFSTTINGIYLIFGHKLHIGTPYRGKHFWIHQIPTLGQKTFPTTWGTYMKLVTKYQISAINSG